MVNAKSLEGEEAKRYRYSLHNKLENKSHVPSRVQLNINTPVVFLHENVQFVCKYSIGESRLYSIKWYRNDKEFFRYVPHEVPKGNISDSTNLNTNNYLYLQFNILV